MLIFLVSSETFRILSDDEIGAAFRAKDHFYFFELTCEIEIVPISCDLNLDSTLNLVEELAGDFNFWLFVCYCLCFGILFCFLPLNLMYDRFFITGLVATFFFAFGVHSKVYETERDQDNKRKSNKILGEKLRKLKEMGFNDRKKNSKILSQKNGNFEESLEELIAEKKS